MRHGKHKAIRAAVGLFFHKVDRVVGLVVLVHNELLHRYFSRIVASHLLKAIKHIVLFIVIALMENTICRVFPSGQVLVDDNRISHNMYGARILGLDMGLLATLIFLDAIFAKNQIVFLEKQNSAHAPMFIDAAVFYRQSHLLGQCDRISLLRIVYSFRQILSPDTL